MRLHNFFRLSSLQNKTEIELFSSDVHVLVEVLDAQAKKIEFEKLKAIGQRNAVESEIENRENKKKAMQAQINEKLSELERFNKQYQSLQQIESEQNALIERLSNNET
jgi:intraflagellar transport protein 20